MSQDTKKILMNKEVISVNQDSLGIYATRIKKEQTSEVWAAQVTHDGAGVVAVLFNQASIIESIIIEFDYLLISGTQNVRDLINQIELGESTNSFTPNFQHIQLLWQHLQLKMKIIINGNIKFQIIKIRV